MTGRPRVFMKAILRSEVVVLAMAVVVEAVVAVKAFGLVVIQIRPDEPANIPYLSALEAIHSPQSVWENDDAPENMPLMVATLDTSHVYTSPLNDGAERNISTIVITLDTSHLEMSPLNDDAE